MNRYESYKPTDIDWVGEIPSHWETVQPKYKLNRVTRPIDNEDEVITCFRDGVVTLRKNRREDGFTNSVKEHGYQQIHPGDLVVHEMDGFAGAIGISDSKGKSTPVYTVVEPDDRADLKYIAYLLREMSQTGKIESLARSIRERTTDFRWNMWSVINFPFPPIEEQKLISCYLDNKTSQIDSLVEKIQKKIELLKEQRTSLINHYVTKGLDPNVEMKDSGVEWIGEIPKHWEVKKIKHLAQVKRGSSPRPIDDPRYFEEDGRYSWVRIADVSASGKYLERTTEKLSELGSSLSTKMSPGDLFLSIAGTVGKPVITKIECCIHDGFVWFDGLEINRDYLYFLFLVGSCFQGLGKMGTQLNLNTDTVGDVQIPYPNKEEQAQIVLQIENILDKIDRLIVLEQQRANKLSEYRQSLISSVVTGKVRITEDMI